MTEEQLNRLDTVCQLIEVESRIQEERRLAALRTASERAKEKSMLKNEIIDLCRKIRETDATHHVVLPELLAEVSAVEANFDVSAPVTADDWHLYSRLVTLYAIQARTIIEQSLASFVASRQAAPA